MKKIMWSVVLTSLVLVSCSDDSDKIDEFYKLKKERLTSISPNEMPTVSNTYCDAIVFSPGINDYDTYLIINQDKDKVENASREDAFHWYSYYTDDKVYSSLKSGTTYYYKVIIDRKYQMLEKGGEVQDLFISSPVQSVKTKELLIQGYKPEITSIWWRSTYSGVGIDFTRDKEKEDAADGEFYTGKVDYPIEIYCSTTNDVSQTEANLLYKTTLLANETTSYHNWLFKSYDSEFTFYGYDNSLYTGTTYYFRVVVNGISSDVKSFTR